MGLIRAMESFDHTRGLKFISYAVWWIKAYITRAIVKHSSLIRLPANQRLKIIRALKSGKKRENLTDEIQELIRLGQKGNSIHAPVWEGSKATFSDILSDEKTLLPDQIVENESMERFARSLLSDLPEKEAQILKCIYGIGLESPQSLREVGEYFDISHERVRQIRNQAQHRLKKLKIKNILKEKFSGKLGVTVSSNML
jgi:RNA polymerase primary sigma factor